MALALDGLGHPWAASGSHRKLWVTAEGLRQPQQASDPDLAFGQGIFCQDFADVGKAESGERNEQILARI